MANSALQTESAQANLPPSHEIAQDAQADFGEIKLRAEELGELLYVLAESTECTGSMKAALAAVGTLEGMIEIQAKEQQERFEGLWEQLRSAENVAPFPSRS